MMFAQQSCNGFQCNAASSACRTTCAIDSECMPTHYCSGTTCLPKLGDGQNCMTSNQCLNVNGCLSGYADGDADGYGAGTVARFCGALPGGFVAIAGDCCDSNNQVRPNQTLFFSTAITGACSSLGFNYDCSLSCFLSCVNTIQHELPINGCVSSCSPTTNCTGSGWQGTSFPGCGVSGTRRNCSQGTLDCGGPIIFSCIGVTTQSFTDRCK